MPTRTAPQPFGASLSWMLVNPIAAAHSKGILRRLRLREGMQVVDVGCGVGRLAIPVAKVVGERGEVVALDVQEAMLEKLQQRAANSGVHNIKTIHAPAGSGALPVNAFDVALLVAVLGEIPADIRLRAIQEIATSLRDDGTLAVVEGPPDPHRQSPEAVIGIGLAAGLRPMSQHRLWGGRLLQLRKPA